MESQTSSIRQLLSLFQHFCIHFVLIVILAHYLSPAGIAQTTENAGERLEEIIERAVAELDPETSEVQIIELIERLENLANNPVNINRAGLDELSGVPGISLKTARSIIRFRNNIKPFESTYELMEAEGIGMVTFENILPFVTVGESAELRRDLYLNPGYWTHDSRFETLAGYQRVLNSRDGYSRPDSLGGYLGGPVKYNHRIRYRSDHLSVNLTQDKDPGEVLAGPSGFDYTSWHLAIEDVGLIENIIIGDFRVSYGQGLTIWNGGAFGKSSSVIGSAIKSDTGIRPYTSYQETNGFRGVAATVGSKLQLSGFYSKRRRSASEADNGRLRFPASSGLHRTANEMSRRLNMGQHTFGGRLRYQFKNGIIGLSSYQNTFSHAIQKGTQSFQLFDFEGKAISALGTDIRLNADFTTIFGEIARSSNGSFGGIVGSEMSPAGTTDLAIAYRNYARDYQSIFGSGFGEQSGSMNESGFFSGIRQQVGPALQLNAYIDFFKTHGPRFRNSRPTSGFDWLVRVDVEPLDKLSIYMQLRAKKWQQQMDAYDSFGRETLIMGSELRSNARLHLEYQVLDNVRLRTRIDAVRYTETLSGASLGYLIYQDVRYLPASNLTLDARITLFETDDFNSRVFQFENDLLYVMSNTMLFDQGQRSYIVIRYQPSHYLTFRIKAATTLYENRQIIGSGLDMISGRRKTDIGFQIQLKI